VSMSATLTAARLKELLDYDPETGVFHWPSSAQHCRAGMVAGSKNNKGYIQIGVERRNHAGHRLAWLYVHGKWPTGGLDHVNCDPTDNRIANLRVATDSQNQANKRARPGRLKGVTYLGELGKWQAAIFKSYYLGVFDTEEEANRVYGNAARILYDEFARSS
jgi:hypothetical protein